MKKIYLFLSRMYSIFCVKDIQSHTSFKKKVKGEKFNSDFYWSIEVLLLTCVVNSVVWHDELHSKTCTVVAYLKLYAGC